MVDAGDDLFFIYLFCVKSPEEGKNKYGKLKKKK
jgi:hypothetical protein